MNKRNHRSASLIELLDADSFARRKADSNSLAVLDLSRNEIESGNIASALERLLVFTDTPSAVAQYRERLVFQVRGYDADPRELYEIPAVRTFFKRLSRDFPHWLWFLHRRVGAVALLLSLLCSVRRVDGHGGQVGFEFTDHAEFQATLADLFHRGNALFDAMGVSEKDADESANSALTELFA